MMLHLPSQGYLRCQTATRPLHKQLDDRLGSLRLDDPSQYFAFLTAMATGFGPWENWLEHHWHLAPNELQPVWRTPKLLKDMAALAQLHMDAYRRTVSDIAGHGEMTAANPCCAGCIAGALYVLEGSRQGARLLVQLVPAAFPKEFLADTRIVTPWPQLRAMLDSLGSRETECAVYTATLVFQWFVNNSGCPRTASVVPKAKES